VPESDWGLLYNGLDLEHFRPQPDLRTEFRRRHGLNGGPVIGVACALRPGKQLEHLFAAVGRVSAPGLCLLLAGGPVPGDERYAEKLLRQGKEQLQDRLVCLGYLKELRGFYNALDVFVNTSLAETCSISVMESLACGCPVVGYPSTSVDEQVLPGGGEIVAQDRVDLLALALERWLKEPAALASARSGARHRAEETFDIRRIADQLWDEYQRILAEPAA
jgi:glycosyltransferase involved in cell wall biosynthesis